MRVAHFAPFAPHRCGLYETARDLIKAERLLGLTADLVDVGVDGRRTVGAVDERGGFEIRTRDYEDALAADVLVAHSDLPRSVLARTRAPVVQIVHGRPESSFRMQQRGESPVYDLHSRRAADPRWARFVTLWPEHMTYWQAILPAEKLRTTSAPPCDLELYSPDGPVHEWETPGAVNLLVADMWRADEDPYHVLHGIAQVADQIPGLRVHVYAAQNPIGPWSYVFRYLRRRGILGDLRGVMLGFDSVLRAADAVVTPHKIATRLVRESTAVGTTVIHAPGDAADVAAAVLSWRKGEIANPDPSRYALERIGPEVVRYFEEALQCATVEAA